MTGKRQLEMESEEGRSQKASRTMAGTRTPAGASTKKFSATNSTIFSKSRRQQGVPGPLRDCLPGGGGVQGEVRGSAGGPVLAPVFTSSGKARAGEGRKLESETAKLVGQRLGTSTVVANHSTATTGSWEDILAGNFGTDQLIKTTDSVLRKLLSSELDKDNKSNNYVHVTNSFHECEIV